jgi:hypothetical protein
MQDAVLPGRRFAFVLVGSPLFDEAGGHGSWHLSEDAGPSTPRDDYKRLSAVAPMKKRDCHWGLSR